MEEGNSNESHSQEKEETVEETDEEEEGATEEMANHLGMYCEAVLQGLQKGLGTELSPANSTDLEGTIHATLSWLEDMMEHGGACHAYAIKGKLKETQTIVGAILDSARLGDTQLPRADEQPTFYTPAAGGEKEKEGHEEKGLIWW
mmetsp:Transcript_54637/g.159471  ORF Transcript_54637/g.159471 Transcript_54637/m.159471 type:complete len:146 (-) Transcript_54637:168-605(-)